MEQNILNTEERTITISFDRIQEVVANIFKSLPANVSERQIAGIYKLIGWENIKAMKL